MVIFSDIRVFFTGSLKVICVVEWQIIIISERVEEEKVKHKKKKVKLASYLHKYIISYYLE